jgi:hypothetical protein
MGFVRCANAVKIALLAATVILTGNARLAAQTKLALKDGTVTVNGELAKDDTKDTVRNQPCKIYVVDLKGGQTYQIDMARTKNIDPYLRLEDFTGKELASDDDGGGFPNARIIFKCPKDGAFRIIATTFNGSVGTYALAVTKTVELALKTGKASVAGNLTKDDAKDTARRASACKIYTIKLTGGKTYQIDMVSKDVDSFLRLEDANGKELARDDDGGGFPNARIVFTSPEAATYRIIATTFSGRFSGEAGAFTLTVAEK